MIFTLTCILKLHRIGDMNTNYHPKPILPEHQDNYAQPPDVRPIFDSLRQKANTLFTAVIDLPPCSDDADQHFARVFLFSPF